MDNISFIASLLQLVVFGLFLITCPAEEYVAGWPDWSDLSDQGQEPTMSDAERQNELKRTDALKSELESDGNLIYGSENNQGTPSPQEIINKYDESVNQVSTDYQNDETSWNDVTDGKKRDDEKIVPMTDGIKEKDVLLTNGQQDNEIGTNFAHNTAAIIILPLPSRL